MKYYTFTIRKCSNTKTIKTLKTVFKVYESYLNYFKKMDSKIHIEYHYEYTAPAKGQYNVHLHAMIKTPNKIPYIRPKKGYSIQLQICKNKAAWQAYITKNPYTKEQIEKLITMYINPKDSIYNTISHNSSSIETEDSDDKDDSPDRGVIMDDKIDWSKSIFTKLDSNAIPESGLV